MNTRFLDACAGRPVDKTPVWLMRQAGRYQASYRELRKKYKFFELCQTPEVSAQVTVTAVEELGVDAAIIFSDILVPVRAMGAPVELTEQGPKLAAPLRTASDVAALRVVDPASELSFVMDAIQLTNRGLDNAVPLIGFAGGPLTLASYLVEGGHSSNFIELKRMLFTAPQTAHVLLDKLAQVIVLHLRAQVAAGCHAVQLFESWGGILGPDDFREFVFPYHQRIFAELADLGVPRISFGTSMGALLDQMKASGPDVIGVDWRLKLKDVRAAVGAEIPLQGNLDPCCLLMNQADLETRIQHVLNDAAGGPHIFNLGHGVLPPTPPENARFLVDTVHRLSAQHAS